MTCYICGDAPEAGKLDVPVFEARADGVTVCTPCAARYLVPEGKRRDEKPEGWPPVWYKPAAAR